MLVLVGISGILFYLDYCNKEEELPQKKMLEVTATAYNSLAGQTYGHPSEAAWGDTLKPGMKAIAVSRDLLDSGLTYGTRVNIEGLPGEYVVLDKMNARWKRKIDIYMGESIASAKEWGKRKVLISWRDEHETSE